MALPNPLPDNPQRWDGWRHYNSENLYDRLCLAFDSNPSPEQIEDNCRQLLVWWQKKLPLKNQPSNPVAQMLRAGLDEAPKYLAEARTLLLDGDARARIDLDLHERIVLVALEEFKKLLSFALAENKLREEDEQRLYQRGRSLGLGHDVMKDAIDAELVRLGAERVAAAVPAPVMIGAPVPPTAEAAASPGDEFRRMLRLSKLGLDGDDMTDDQRDALCNMGEGLGLTGGEAEDVIDEYLEECSGAPIQPPVAARAKPSATAAQKPEVAPAKAAIVINTSPLARAEERQKHLNFTNKAGVEMLLVTSGMFAMGSESEDASPHEQPVARVTVGCFFLSRFPITNAQFELFDRTHASKRAPWANERHPVVYISSREAEKFCQWLSAREGKKYRLPTEAEWEYAARGTESRVFPWGEKLDSGQFANFADKRTAFAWRDITIDDGHAETAPVGSYPRGASPFGIEDMAGNVFEWCLDFLAPYKSAERTNPRGPSAGAQRIYRGGSWKSRASNLRTSARNFNVPDYSSNDVAFRIVCECES